LTINSVLCIRFKIRDSCLHDKTTGLSLKKEVFFLNNMPFDKIKRYAFMISVHSISGGVFMKRKNKQNHGPKKQEETKSGYGDKKLEGPNRPST